jgi:hypothetical protein
MASYETISKKDPMNKWILAGIPVLFLLSVPLHFLFEWTGRSPVAGVFSPVNESVWEHLKLIFWPVLIWWVAGWFLFHKRNNKPFVCYIFPCMISEIVCLLFVTAFHYTYTGAFGTELIVLDIAAVLIAFLLGQYIAFRIYRDSKPGGFALLISVVLLFVITALFVYYTFSPPHLPIFLDKNTGSYGIGG